MTSSLKIIDEFLQKNSMSLDTKKYLNDYLVYDKSLIDLSNDIINNIICDAYEANNDNVKKITDILSSEHGDFLGYVQKEQLKKYLDYHIESDFNTLLELMETKNISNHDLKELCNKFRLKQNDVDKTLDLFVRNLVYSIKQKHDDRIQDYLIFLYSRLVSINEKRKLSLQEIFQNNLKTMRKELRDDQIWDLQNSCSSNKREDRYITIQKFNSEYLKILYREKDHNDKSAIVYLQITQKLYDDYETKDNFYSALFSFLTHAYQEIENHKALVIKVENILSGKLNIKWEIYSYLTIFSEKFQKGSERHQYLFPEQHLADFLHYRFGIQISENELELLQKYYKNEKSIAELEKIPKFQFDDFKKYLTEFRYVYSGFTFIDCLILQNQNNFLNSKEIEFIQNNNELLLIFFKHEIDSRKIPCPVCGSLIISGNSFPELGVRSWECKNPMCSQRSKTNRGKRYSARTIFMQDSTFDFSEENRIPRDLISSWRKDIVENWNLSTLYQMITKYYSLVGDKITIVNADDEEKFLEIADSNKRKLQSLEFEKFVQKTDLSLFNNYFIKSKEFTFTDHFLYDERKIIRDDPVFFEFKTNSIIHGDCFKVLGKVKPNSVDNMVTSPPYYNAREYTQWENLYQYLHDMYKIATQSFTALKKGGVFFFNIGDIFDNEKIVVKSKMGEKRIPLGAYIILIFKQTGFELLDNIVWNKGEPQSNRHKNDGNFVPYYQRPANCYEHIFIFKKPGAQLCLNKNQHENLITKNVQRFTPVYKIVPGGENKYGHTAPFPEEIPLMSVLCFTNPSEIVLDPFLGSGTSIIVSHEHNRVGVGIELNSEYVQLSLKRSQKVGVPVKLYNENAKKLLQENPPLQ